MKPPSVIKEVRMFGQFPAFPDEPCKPKSRHREIRDIPIDDVIAISLLHTRNYAPVRSKRQLASMRYLGRKYVSIILSDLSMGIVHLVKAKYVGFRFPLR